MIGGGGTGPGPGSGPGPGPGQGPGTGKGIGGTKIGGGTTTTGGGGGSGSQYQGGGGGGGGSLLGTHRWYRSDQCVPGGHWARASDTTNRKTPPTRMHTRNVTRMVALMADSFFISITSGDKKHKRRLRLLRLFARLGPDQPATPYCTSRQLMLY